jgi:hypothetical protein
VRIECAVLCDSASVRDNLLHILGAGITNVSLARFPSGLPITFALRAVLDVREQDRREHKLRLNLVNFADESEADIAVTFEFGAEQRAASEVSLTVPIPLAAVNVQRAGKYTIRGSLDDHALPTLPLTVHALADVASHE